jgi:pimeloyl-ACP methyl ester carboxylesterase
MPRGLARSDAVFATIRRRWSRCSTGSSSSPRRTASATGASCTRSTPWLPSTRPLLAIAGADDRSQPALAERIARTAPRDELLTIEGTGHFPFAEAPDRYCPAPIDWLRRTRRSRIPERLAPSARRRP